MSLLLIGLPETFAAKLVQRLREEGDEVRLLLREGSGAEPWKKLGAFVATGEAGDADLIERAATNVRTIVLGLVVLFLAWLLVLSWPRLNGRSRALRTVVVLLLAAATLAHGAGAI